jgi:hypothetical protein
MAATIPKNSGLCFLLRCLLSILCIRFGIVLIKLQTDTVHAMPLVRWRLEPFPLEHMSEMAATVTADNLDALHAPGVVHVSSDGARDRVKIGGPAAARTELVVRLVERSVAGGAVVDPFGRVVFVVFTGECRLGSLLTDYSKLLWMQENLVSPFCRDQSLDGPAWKHTWTEDGSPVLVVSVIGIRHVVFGACAGAEQGPQKRDK